MTQFPQPIAPNSGAAYWRTFERIPTSAASLPRLQPRNLFGQPQRCHVDLPDDLEVHRNDDTRTLVNDSVKTTYGTAVSPPGTIGSLSCECGRCCRNKKRPRTRIIHPNEGAKPWGFCGVCGVLEGSGRRNTPLTSTLMAEPVGFELLSAPRDPATAAKEPIVLAGIGHSIAHLGTARSRTVVGFLWGQVAFDP
jgi:hypothetical protein